MNVTISYDIMADLKNCSQISMSFHNGRDCIIRKIKENTYTVELEAPHEEYLFLSANAVMRILPCSGITEYKVEPAEKTSAVRIATMSQKRALVAKGLFPRLCSPAIKTVEASTNLQTVSASKLPDGMWMMDGHKCTIADVVNALVICMDTPLSVQFSLNNAKPEEI